MCSVSKHQREGIGFNLSSATFFGFQKFKSLNSLNQHQINTKQAGCMLFVIIYTGMLLAFNYSLHSNGIPKYCMLYVSVTKCTWFKFDYIIRISKYEEEQKMLRILTHIDPKNKSRVAYLLSYCTNSACRILSTIKFLPLFPLFSVLAFLGLAYTNLHAGLCIVGARRDRVNFLGNKHLHESFIMREIT